jgi:pimeloyl-ACP methyl ester carboxylesterase
MSTTEPLPEPPPLEEVWLDGRMLTVRRVSEGGTPAVFIHGLGGSSLNWTDLGYQMRGRLDSWAVDLPGFGASPPPRDGDYSIRGQAEAVADLIAEKIAGPVHLFGNSMGGAISVALAGRNPELVRSVTLISPALPGGRITKANMHLPVIAVPGIGERLVNRYLRAPAEWRAKATIDVCYADVDRMPPQRMAEAVAEVQRRDSLPYAADAFAQSTRGLMRSLLDRSKDGPVAAAGRVTAPVLLIYGRQDQLVDPRGGFKAATWFPDARVVVLPDSGHVSQMEHPQMVAGVWRDLIATPHPRQRV